MAAIKARDDAKKEKAAEAIRVKRGKQLVLADLRMRQANEKADLAIGQAQERITLVASQASDRADLHQRQDMERIELRQQHKLEKHHIVDGGVC